VLFGKRRAYQRKVAVAGFDGVVSGDIYVLAPKDNRLLPELLPFLCMSEQFFKFAVDTSAGSLSPRTNWSHLAKFEFALPPLDQQHRIAEILWAMDESSNTQSDFVGYTQNLRRATLLARFNDLTRQHEQKLVRDLGEVQLGRQRAPKYTTGRYSKPYLRVVNVLDGELDLADVQDMDFDERDYARYHLEHGDILITEGDITSPYNVGRSAVFRGEVENCCFQNTLIRFRVGGLLIPEFTQAALQNAFYRGVFAAVASTTTVTHLGAQRFGAVCLPVPPISKQESVCEELSQIDALIVSAKHRAQVEASLRTALLEGLLG
jgi:type I restriction enzyme S subunit